MFKNRPTAMVVYVGIVAFIIMVIAALVVPPAADSVPPTVAVPTAAPTTAASANPTPAVDYMATITADPEVTTTASGLMYKVDTEGSGAKPTVSDTVTVNYEGRLLDGTVFDSSYARNQPATFALNEVIKGWTEGLQLMPVGSKYTFYIPGNLAYGANPPAGSGIPVNATLVFDVELLSIK